MRQCSMSLIREVAEVFRSNFAHDGIVIHAGEGASDAGGGYLGVERLGSLGIEIGLGRKMPDIVLLDRTRNRLFLVETETGHGPWDERRRSELSELFSASSAEVVYVSAFRTRSGLSECALELPWETVAWIAEEPAHLIHFDGGLLLGPYLGKEQQLAPGTTPVMPRS